MLQILDKFKLGTVFVFLPTVMSQPGQLLCSTAAEVIVFNNQGPATAAMDKVLAWSSWVQSQYDQGYIIFNSILVSSKVNGQQLYKLLIFTYRSTIKGQFFLAEKKGILSNPLHPTQKKASTEKNTLSITCFTSSKTRGISN